METSALLAAIVAASDDAIVSKDLNGIITSWNAAAERIFGFSAAEAIGRSILLIIPPDRIDEEAEVLQRIRRGERVDHLETVRRRKDGPLLDVSVTISPIRTADGVIVSASKIARDITEQKRAVARLDEEHRMKDEFLAVLSHELRTPLNAIMGWADMLTSTDMDEASQQRALRSIQRNARVQAQVIEDLFDLFRQADRSATRSHGGLGRRSEMLPPAEPAHAELPLPALQLSHVRALVVDDDREAADLLVYALLQCGADVTAVSSAERALRALSSASFDVLLADIGMPDIDGFRLIRAVRAREGGSPRAPLAAVAITAHAGPGDRERAITAGFDWHLTKPVDAREVIDVVARMMTSVARSRHP